MQRESLTLLSALVDASYRRDRRAVLEEANLALARLRVRVRLARGRDGRIDVRPAGSYYLRMSSVERALLDRIVVDPEILVGKPIVRATRLSVDFLLGLLAQGIGQEEILRDYPTLRADDLRAVLLYAQRVIAGEDVVPMPSSDPR